MVKNIVIFILPCFLLSCNIKKDSSKIAFSDSINNEKPQIQNIKEPIHNEAEQKQNQKETEFDVRDESIGSALNRIKKLYQNINFNADSLKVLEGKLGTKIYYQPGILVNEDGSEISGKVRLELLEMHKASEMAIQGVPTTSNGKLLESGGAYCINFYSGNGKKLKLKQGMTMGVLFPRITKEKMELFYGKTVKNGSFEWVPENSAFQDSSIYYIYEIKVVRFSNDSSRFIEENYPGTPTTKKSNKLIYKITSINQLGWINCDRFYAEKNKTDLIVKLKKMGLENASCYLLFRDINSVMKSNGVFRENKFQNVPVGRKVKLILLAERNGKTLGFTKNVVIQKNMVIDSDLIPFELTNLEKEFKI